MPNFDFKALMDKVYETADSGMIESTDRKYLVGRGNLSCTVFVPWDCKMNCTFCNTKKEYATLKGISLKNVEKGIEIVKRSEPYKRGEITEWVITGGEPFDNLEGLANLLEKIPHDRPIYINSMMPKSFDSMSETELKMLSKIVGQVNGVSVSRHLGSTLDDKIIEYLHHSGVNVRVNCVLDKTDCMSDKLKERIEQHVNRYENISDALNLRADYTGIKDFEDLKGLKNPVVSALCELYPYKGDWGCDVCNDNVFHTENGFSVHFHRGYENTLIRLPNKQFIVNDVIIKPNGDVMLDWNMDVSNNFDDVTIVAEWLSRKIEIAEEEEEAPAEKEIDESKPHRVKIRRIVTKKAPTPSTATGGSSTRLSDTSLFVCGISQRCGGSRSMNCGYSSRSSCGGRC